MSRLWKALVMLVTAASLASCGGGGGGGILGGGCSDEDISALLLYGYLDGTVGVQLRAEPNITGVPSECRAEMRFSLDSGALPPGLILNERSGVISGIPTQGGRYPFVIRLTVKNFDGGLNANLVSLIRDPAEATFAEWQVMSDTNQGFLEHFRIGAIGTDLYVVERGFYQKRMHTFRSRDEGRTWTNLSVALPHYATDFAVASHGNHLYLSGGTVRQEMSSAVWRFDGTTWVLMTPDGGFPKRAGHTMVSHDGALYVLGGYTDNGQVLGDVWRSMDGGATWSQQSANAFPPRFRFCALGDGKGSLYVIGGEESRRFAYLHRRDVWQSSDGGTTWQQVSIGPNEPIHAALEYGAASCSLLGGRMVYVGREHTVSSRNGRDWLTEPHWLWLSGTAPGAVTMDGHLYVVTGEGTSQRFVVRTGP